MQKPFKKSQNKILSSYNTLRFSSFQDNDFVLIAKSEFTNGKKKLSFLGEVLDDLTNRTIIAFTTDRKNYI